ncbi:tribbles homolog 3 [Leptonychotes weddellii]|uniref:Tribbles homolog 3 n=1 Tax=Leptonychotes weddellii TaxID=9713 RepID=A0A7F8QVN5_LEPWE|nr:tribbles homolog 3 [Leptonychotes weddellii]
MSQRAPGHVGVPRRLRTPAARPAQMQVTPLAAPMGAPSRRKRLELDSDLDTECPTRKQARSGPQPRLPPCPLPLIPPPAPAQALAVTTASRLGPYVLLEPEEGGRAYRALRCPIGTEYTCKVGPLGSLSPSITGAWKGPWLQRTVRVEGSLGLLCSCVYWGSSQ